MTDKMNSLSYNSAARSGFAPGPAPTKSFQGMKTVSTIILFALLGITPVALHARVKLVALPERARISYLLSGLNREIVYKAVAQPNESAMALRNYLRLRNNSGEDFANAEIGIGYGERFQKNLAHEEVLELLSEKVEALPIKKQ